MIRSILRFGFGACLFVISASSTLPLQADDQSRQRLTADFGWKFIKGDTPDASRPDFDDSGWRTVNLPHDWSIEGPYTQSDPTGGGGGSLPTGIGWYRRTFNAPEAWRGKEIFVEFDGVYMNSDVWINGRLLGHRPFGYIGFEYNLTPYLKFGQTNVVSVRVDNSH
jgi:beta-galactosidase